MSAFDKEAFLAKSTKSDFATKMTPIPEGEYTAQIAEVDARQQRGKEGNEFVVLDVTWEIIGKEDLAKQLNRRQLTCRQGMILDISSDGSIAEGENKNVKLGRIRAAVGQNQSGKVWSPMQLKGAGPATIVVGHRTDPNDSDIVYDEVKRVRPMSVA